METLDSLLQDAARRAARHLASLDGRAVMPPPEAGAALRAALPACLPEDGLAPGEVLAFLDEHGSPATVASPGGRYFGFVIGGALPASLAASWLVSAWDQNAAMGRMSPAAVAFERSAVRWIVSALGLPETAGGAFVTGATMANASALAAARHAVLERAGWDVEARGLFGAPEIQVVVSAEIHATVRKALGILGLGRARVTEVPVDAQGRMRADALPPLRAPAIVCAQAGNVNSGAFDPFEAIAARTREAGAWLHVDGAFGLWALAAPERAPLAAGIERADSWATDAHKWLNTPYDCGLVLLGDARALRAAMGIRAPYLLHAEEEPADFTPDSSRRARGVEVWAALASLGRRGLAELVERSCRHAARFADGLAAAGLPVLNDVVLNQVVLGLTSPEEADAVVGALEADGTCWCGPTRWQGRAGLRISVSCWRTTREDVERSLGAIVAAVERVRAGRT